MRFHERRLHKTTCSAKCSLFCNVTPNIDKLYFYTINTYVTIINSGDNNCDGG